LRPVLWLALAGAGLALGIVLLVSAFRWGHRPTSPGARPQGQSQAEADAIRERNAETIFLRATDAVANRRWQAAEEHLTLLAQEYPRTSFYAAHRAETAELERAADEGKRWRPPAPTGPAPPPQPPGPLIRTPEELHAAFSAQDPEYRDGARIEVRAGQIVSVFMVSSRRLRSLEPLRGLPLERLRVAGTLIADLSPLEGMPLKQLACDNNRITNLAPLKGMPLARLICPGNQITDLSPLAGMPLTELSCSNNLITDLSPLKGMPMAFLSCAHNRIADLSPLRELPLATLDCSHNPIVDLSPLRGHRLKRLHCEETQAADLSPLAGMPLEDLYVSGLPIRDVSILRALPLRELSFSLDKVQGDLQCLRDHPTLERIGFGPGKLMPVEPFRMALDVQAGRRPRPTPAELAKLDDPWRKRLDDTFAKKVGFDFVETPLQDVVAFLGSLVDLTIVLDVRAIEDTPKTVTLRVNDMPMSEVMAVVVKQVGLAHVPLDEVVFVTTPELAKSLPGLAEETRLAELPPAAEFVAGLKILYSRISFDFVETPLQDVVTFISSLVDAPIVLDIESFKDAPKNVTLRAKDMRLGNAFRCVCRLAGAACIWRDGVVFVATPERVRDALRQDREFYAPQPPPKEYEAAMARPIRFDFQETPLADVATWFGEAAKLPVAFDPKAVKEDSPPLSFRLDATRCDRALRWIGRMTGTVPVWREGKILFTTPERAKRP